MNRKPVYAYIYLIHLKGTQKYKIGWTHDLDQRLKAMPGQYVIPYDDLELLTTVKVFWERRRGLEKSILQTAKLWGKNLDREWYELTNEKAKALWTLIDCINADGGENGIQAVRRNEPSHRPEGGGTDPAARLSDNGFWDETLYAG